jgi:rhamnogalacturonan endolyase
MERLERRAMLNGGTNPIPARQMEALDRGVVAINKGSGQVYVGWRLLGTDASNVAFNLYRSLGAAPAVKLNASPITQTTDYLDTGVSLSTSVSYFVRPVIGGVEQPASETYSLPAGAPAQPYLSVPLQIPPGGTCPDGSTYTYSANDCSVGDLDGDGKYEIVVKWDPSNSRDNAFAGNSGNCIIDAYEMNGTRLWRIDIGKNIRAGAHYTQFMVYDLDGNGKAEMVCKTADGTIDGVGHVIGNPNADWREPPGTMVPTTDSTGSVKQPDGTYLHSTEGYIMHGPEYLTVFDGVTGAALATTNYLPALGDTSLWGDLYTNRSDRFLACVAYLDGQRPSVVMCRGYYARTTLAAWDWRNGQLTLRWLFDSDDGTPGNRAYRGQGNHQVSVADVDGDGRDEIIYGGCAIDDDGTGLYSTGLGHGDAMHVGDLDPSRPGLEVWGIHEGASTPGSALYDAATGEVIWQTANADVGRGVAADLTASFAGAEVWGGTSGLRSINNQSAGSSPSSSNFVVWWDADLLRELENSNTISKYGGSTLLTASGCSSNNSTKSTPCLAGDILGDWREEVIWRKSDNTELRIYTTTISAANRMYTLMHDRQYRLGIAWQNVAYNQPPHPGFYLGDGMSAPPTPNIYAAPLDLAAPMVTSSSFTYDTAQQVKLWFSEGIDLSTISASDLILRPRGGGADVAPLSVNYDSAAHTATFSFAGILPDGNYEAILPAGRVADLASNWSAASYSMDLFVLGGDANHDRIVDITDLYILASNWHGTAKVFSQGDFNYDTKVDAKDLGILSTHWQAALPAPAPTPPLTLHPTAPRRTPRVISLIQ